MKKSRYQVSKHKKYRQLTSLPIMLLAVFAWLSCHAAFAQTQQSEQVNSDDGITATNAAPAKQVISVGMQHSTPVARIESKASEMQATASVSSEDADTNIEKDASDELLVHLQHKLQLALQKRLEQKQVVQSNQHQVDTPSYQGLLREWIIVQKKAQKKEQAKEDSQSAQSADFAQSQSLLSVKVSQPTDAALYYDFSIYDAYSRLFDDFNYNGFYQTFSVTFDADILGPTGYEIANVYAEMYLSRNGGPWEHYYTTDIFTIEGDRTDDDYEVLTTLASGYPTDHYDVLIDLYEVGYSDIVATISSEDVDSLYALPLESRDWDSGSSEVVIVEEYSAGSLGAFGLFVMLIVAVRRKAIH
ncbi:choice-of-anchor H family protein [Shewanella maritima]|uniref:choice-of-anchor H family protein n=1 Tax=Shewanella maritima TaxID=2520507 RepID=UPI001F5E5613|nr:choice-of-anchor H family protein [Shewanella maritima]